MARLPGPADLYADGTHLVFVEHCAPTSRYAHARQRCRGREGPRMGQRARQAVPAGDGTAVLPPDDHGKSPAGSPSRPLGPPRCRGGDQRTRRRAARAAASCIPELYPNLSGWSNALKVFEHLGDGFVTHDRMVCMLKGARYGAQNYRRRLPDPSPPPTRPSPPPKPPRRHHSRRPAAHDDAGPLAEAAARSRHALCYAVRCTCCRPASCSIRFFVLHFRCSG